MNNFPSKDYCKIGCLKKPKKHFILHISDDHIWSFSFLSMAIRITLKNQQLSIGSTFLGLHLTKWCSHQFNRKCKQIVQFIVDMDKTKSRGRCVDSQALVERVSRRVQETMMKCSISAVINSFPCSSSSRSVPFPPTVKREGSLWSVCVRFPWHTVHLWVWAGKPAGRLHQRSAKIPSQCFATANRSSQDFQIAVTYSHTLLTC